MAKVVEVLLLAFIAVLDSPVAQAQKLRVCVGEFPSYAIGLDFLLQNKRDYEVSQSTVYACSIRFKKNYFDLVLGDSFIYVTNYLEDPGNRIVSLVNYSDGVDQIIAQKGKSPTDLPGSRWALQKGTMSTVLLSFYLKTRQLSLRDVVLEDVKVENTPQVIGPTRFYGVVNWQPYARNAVQRGAQVLATSADFQDKLYDFVITRQSVIEKYRTKIRAYLQERLQRARNMNQVHTSYAAVRKVSAQQSISDFEGLYIYRSKAEVLRDQERVLQSLRVSAEVADISQYSGTQVQDLLKKREKDIFDFSMVE